MSVAGVLRSHVVRRWIRASTRWHLRRAQSVGERARIEGLPRIDVNELVVGSDLLVWSHRGSTRLTGRGRLEIGDRVFLNEGAVIHASNLVRIGDDVAVGWGVLVMDSQQHGLAGCPLRHEVTVIGSGCWLGAHSKVLAGVTVGNRSVVAAGAVVTRDVPPDSVVAGVPATVIRTLTYPEGVTTAWNNVTDPDYWDDGGRAPHPPAKPAR